MKILLIKTLWFTNSKGCIGIVLGEDSVTGEKKGYISQCRGDNERQDTHDITRNGSKFTKETAEKIFNHFKGGSG